MSRWLGLGLAVALLIGFMPVATREAAAQAAPSSLAAAGQWLRGQQNDDGGFGSPRSDGGVSTDAALAFAATGVDLASVRKGGRSLRDYLEAITPEYGKTPAGAAKLTLAATAAGLDPRAFGGSDLVRIVAGGENADGQIGDSLFQHGYAVLALAAAGEPVSARAVARIVDSQLGDGAWGFAGPGQPGDGDSNTTALLAQALAAAGQPDGPARAAALGYLKQTLTPGGGFTYAPGQENPPTPDANSTALVVQALLALNVAPTTPEWGGALARLGRFQNASGAFRWKDDQPEDNLLATVQALPALAALPFPFGPADASGTRARRLAARAVPTAAPAADRAFFPETGHTLTGGFKGYWERNGGLGLFGLPLTEEFQEVNPADNRTYTVQYFERARFEYHPEFAGTEYEVQLGLLGRQATAGRTEPWFSPVQTAPDSAGCTTFREVGHALCAPYRDAWQAGGGLAIFGLPISEVFEEGGRQVQYFERARLEASGGAISIGLLGRELLYRPGAR